MKLTETKPDQTGVVRKIGGDAHFMSRITAIGVTEGADFQTVRNDRKMPVLIYLRESHSLKWTARVASFYVCGALLLSCVVYHIAALFL